tara:strand:- start:831 stop:1694 length:864 start_codon:yes stop_codon:yes gene_type:complete
MGFFLDNMMRLLDFIVKAIDNFIQQCSFNGYHPRDLYALASKISYGSHRQKVLKVDSKGDFVIPPMTEQEAKTQSIFVFRHVKAAHKAIVKTFTGNDRFVLLNNLIDMLAAVVVQGPLHCTHDHENAILNEAEVFFKKNGLKFSNLNADKIHSTLKNMKFAQDNDRKIIFCHVISCYRQYLSYNAQENQNFIDHIDELTTSRTIQSLAVFDKLFMEKIKHMPPYLFKSFIKDVSDSCMIVVENKRSVHSRSYSIFGGKYPLSKVRAVIEDIEHSTSSRQLDSNFNAS